MKCAIIPDARQNIHVGRNISDSAIVVKNWKYTSCGSCRQVFALIAMFWMMVQCEARSSGIIHVPARSTVDYPDLPNTKRFQTADRHDKLYKSYSGDPWASSLITNYGNASIHVPPYANVTSNNTENNQLPIINEAEFESKRRMKRGVVHLYNMVVCATGCNPLAYKGYGCYCGFLGSGYVIDGIDRCCKMHDWCYDATECPMFMEYFVPYYWRCYHGYKPVCAVEHGEWGSAGSCAQRLCECDRSLAECLRRYPCPSTKAVCTSSPWRLVQNIFMNM